MYSSSFFVFFSVLSTLLSGVAAYGTIYRFDNRAPATIKNGGGFKSKGGDPATQENLFKHCGPGSYANDPFISTSPLMDLSHHGNYRYTLDSSKIPDNKIWNVAEEYRKAGKKNDYEEEQELSIEREIPWSAVIAVAQFSEEDFMFKPLDMPKKRAMFAHDARRAEIEDIVV
jgi:hypothetical protein